MILLTVFDRSIVVIASADETDAHNRRPYSVSINGAPSGNIRLLDYYKPSVGFFTGGDFAVWAGPDAAFGSLISGDLSQILLPEPILAIYSLRNGWLAIAEISVFTITTDLSVASRSIHNDVIMTGYWSSTKLILRDFTNQLFSVDVDEDSLATGDIIPHVDTT